MSLNTLPFNPFPPSSDQKGSGGGGSYVLPAATAETLGGIKVGDNLTVEEDGTLNAADPYTLPIAADDTLGGVIVGDNLTVEEDGTLNAPDPYSPPDYSTTEHATGKKWIDGKDIYRKVIANVADNTTIATGVDTIVNCIIARHGASSDNKRHVFGDGFTVNDGGSIYLDTTKHEAEYAVWASTGGNLEKAADHIIIEYTKVEEE